MLRFAVAIGAICSARALPYDDLNEDDALTPEQTALIEKSDAFSEREIAEAMRQGDVDLIMNARRPQRTPSRTQTRGTSEHVALRCTVLPILCRATF